MAIFKGAGVALITPMKENGDVNFDKLGEIIDFQVDNNTDSIIICGTTGEASTLSHEEHIECIRYAVEKTAKRIPVIAGTGSNSTDTAIYLSKEAQKCGADGLLLVSPYYNKATQKGLIIHFTDIAQSVDLPIILYNVPGRTGCNILPETVVKLAKSVDNIIGIKEASGDISQIARLARLAEGELDIYSGNDDQIAPIMALGGLGVISVLSNIAPRQTHDIASAYLDGNQGECTKLQLEALDLINSLFCEVNPIPVKTAMNLMGMNVGPLRKPLSPMEEADIKRLKRDMLAFGLKLA
jgi:4-hydroxy-tetrahydrodipicolinate synthase